MTRPSAVRGLALRLVAAAVAIASLAGSTTFVAANPKNPEAPLRPPVITPVPTAAPSPRPLGRLHLEPGVRTTTLRGITFTHVS